MRRIVAAIGVLSLLLSCIAATTAEAQQDGAKVALVIGNGAYRAHDPLPSAGADSAAVAAALRELDFDVIEHKNLGNGAFRAALNSFAQALRPGGIALFYYMGHGLQIEGENFLLPVGSRLRRASDRITLAIPLSAILHIMERSGARANVVLLDAAYPDRFSAADDWSQPGLAAPEVRGADSFVMLADWPGRESPPPPPAGSPFARALVDALDGPRPELIAVAEIVAQRLRDEDDRWPWIGPGFKARTVLGREALVAEPEAPEAPPAADYFEQAQNATGEQERVRPVPRDDPPPAAPEPAVVAEPSAPEPPPEAAFELSLSAAERGRIQRDLRTLELYRGRADRIFGRGTRSGIRKLQAALGEAETGYLSESQRRALAARAAERRQATEAEARKREGQASAPQSADRTATAQVSRGEPAPAAQQAAAPSNLPFGTIPEAQALLEQRVDFQAKLQRYNRSKYLLEHQSSFKILYIDSLEVTRLSGTRITARVTFTVTARRQGRSTGTFDLQMRWTGTDIEILSHTRK